MTQDNTNKITLQNSGDHHQALIAIDQATGKISASTIMNFSDNSAVGLNIDDNGKTTGTIAHAGDTHSFITSIASDGSIEGKYRDTKAGLELEISGGIAKMVKGSSPQLNISQEGDHHQTALCLGENGKLSGFIESRSTDDNSFRVELQDGKLTSGTFTHKGENHETNVTLTQNGWKANLSGGSGTSKWSVGVENGKAIKGKVDLKF
jgi:hypothetical protein